MYGKRVLFAVSFYISLTMGLHIRLYTHNIRYNATNLQPNERPWSERAPVLMRDIMYSSRHLETFIMLQEALINQLNDIVNELNAESKRFAPNANEAEWAYYGVGRDDGKTGGEFSPILYRPGIWTLEASNTTWLCPPDKQYPPGQSCWGATLPRILTIVRFRHRASGRQIVAMNTHLDNDSSTSRKNSAALIQEKIREWTEPDNSEIAGGTQELARLPMFLGGDLNSTPSMEAYKGMTGPDALTDDLKGLVDPRKHYGFEYTFTGFNYTTSGCKGAANVAEVSPPQLIDFLFLGPRGENHWRAKAYACMPNVFDNGIYMSDHRAVIGDAELLSEPSEVSIARENLQQPLR